MRIYYKLQSIQLSSTTLTALVALYFTLILNYPFYRQVLTINPLSGNPSDYFLFTVPFFIFFALNIAFQLFALPWLHKVLMPALILVSAIVSYNQWAYGIYFDKEMLVNVLQTNRAEALHLMTLPYILWTLVFGVLPAILYILVKVKYRSVMREILWRVSSLFISALVIVGIAKFFYQDYASFGRNNKQIVHLILPSNIIGASLSTLKNYYNSHRTFEHIGLDAKQQKQDNIRRVVVLIMGETTRAQNWGLNGYVRQTTPQLAQRNDIINFPNVTSCGTATAYSIPCLFSHLSRTEFNNNDAPYRDNLLDILQRAGIDVAWYDNDAGCKGVCERVPHYDMTALNVEKYCQQGECLDEILLENLEQAINHSDKDTFIVLHTIGSHGPTYYQRYPQAFRQFIPTCDTNQVNQCSDQQLVNTYDNTILYVDHMINQTIGHLAQHTNLASSVIYVSDHGESLGENGIYLHSSPYSIAPKEQTQVPMVMWFSPYWQAHSNTDFTCLQQQAKIQAFSHDNLFHSLANLFELNTFKAYRPSLNIFTPCQSK